MRHRLSLLAALLTIAMLLPACSGTPAAKPATTPPAAEPSTPPEAKAGQGGPGAQPGAQTGPTQPPPADITVERQPGHLTVQGRIGVAQARLSPEAAQVALIYGVGDLQYPDFALGVLPLKAPQPAVATDAGGLVLEVARFDRVDTVLPTPLLLGWLDENQVVLLTASFRPDGPTAPQGPGLRAEVWDVTSKQRTGASAWVSPTAGQGMGGMPQAWLAGTGETARVMLKARALWRLDPKGSPAELLVDDLPAIKNLGAYVTASPDRWIALYGGGMNSPRHGVADLRTGRDLPLPEAWRQIRTGGSGRLVALTNTEARPGKALSDHDFNREFFSTVLVAGADGQVQQELALPDGLLTESAYETPQGWVVVETSRVTRDAAGRDQVTPGPLLAAAPAPAPPATPTTPAALPLRPLWTPPEQYVTWMPRPWLLTGDWLLVDRRQMPLDGSPAIPWPDAIQTLIPLPEDALQPTDTPVVVGGAGRERFLFVAGRQEALPLGRASSEEKLLQLDVADGWAVVRFWGENGRSELHLVAVRP